MVDRARDPVHPWPNDPNMVTARILMRLRRDCDEILHRAPRLALRRASRWSRAAWQCGLALALSVAALQGAAFGQGVDHYILALSWSPTFCETADPDRERLQCNAEADNTFVVHGLWPNTRDDDPVFCRTDVRSPTRREVDAMLDIMPSRSLVRYEWRKHGTCSGLTAARYLATVRKAFASVTVPPGLATLRTDIDVRASVMRDAFLQANPGLPRDGIAVRCEAGQLSEVRLCLTPDLDFRRCPGSLRDSCGRGAFDVPAPE